MKGPQVSLPTMFGLAGVVCLSAQPGLAHTEAAPMADNGIFKQYGGTSGLSELIYRGGKIDHLDEGVRSDAFVRWPGVIEAGSAAGGIENLWPESQKAVEVFTSWQPK